MDRCRNADPLYQFVRNACANLLSEEIVEMRIIRKIKNNFDSLGEVELFIRIFLLLTILPSLVRFLPLPQLMKLLTPKDSKECKNLNLNRYIGKVVKFTDYMLSLNFWVYKPTCLKRSLVLYHFLRETGINVHICFGVKFSGQSSLEVTRKKLEGHAWLLYNGNIFLEKNTLITQSFKPIYYF